MPPPFSRRQPGHSRAFTIIELLTVIAIIGILAAILIPTLTGSQVSAKRAKTRVQFSQWATAIEGFRQEYGYYPDFRTSSSDEFLFGNDGKINTAADATKFVQALSGKDLDGTPLESGDPGWAAGNRKGIVFCTFGPNDLTNGGKLQDAFGNTEIALIYDTNSDNQIRTKGATNPDYATSTPDVLSVNGASVTTPAPDGTVVMSSLILYSAGDGTQAVKSW